MPVSYLVRLEDGRVVRCHQEHLRKNKVDCSGKITVSGSMQTNGSVTENNSNEPDVLVDLTFEQQRNIQDQDT